VRLTRVFTMSALSAALGVTAAAAADLRELDIEALGEIEVISASRRPESVNDAAAAVYVITQDEIRRSGVTSIPEALRLAPGVEVARNSSSSWTISMRGFSSDLSNKLLVLIDGRSVYSPLFAGVYWDAQSTLLEDIERIEVIAGPGGTAWGANAVNGVINIITRSAWDTTGGIVSVGGGDELQLRTNARYGGKLGKNVAARAYAERLERDSTRNVSGASSYDAWESTQAGFRLDWAPTAVDALSLQGDIYDLDENARLRSDFAPGTVPRNDLRGTVDVTGHNVVARWDRILDTAGSFRLQLFYDYTRREIPGSFDESRNTFDVDFVHHLPLYGRHDLLWGFGVRGSHDDIGNTSFATFDPASMTAMRYSGFAQDKIALLSDKVFLTLGMKLEHNDFSGLEYQPNARLSWLLNPRHTAWAAVSRAVRIPGRLEQDVELNAPVNVPDLPVPLYIQVRGNEGFDAEELVAYELGYRASLSRTLSFDLTLFLHDYDKLLTNEIRDPVFLVPGPPAYLVLPIVLGNGLRGETFGSVVQMKWKPIDIWQLSLQYAYTGFDLELRPGSNETNALNVEGNTPKHQAAVYSYLQLHPDLSFFTGLRYVDHLPNQDVPSYVALDVNLAWQLARNLRVSAAVQNLDDARHAEFGEGNLIERSVFFKLDVTF